MTIIRKKMTFFCTIAVASLMFLSMSICPNVHGESILKNFMETREYYSAMNKNNNHLNESNSYIKWNLEEMNENPNEALGKNKLSDVVTDINFFSNSYKCKKTTSDFNLFICNKIKNFKLENIELNHDRKTVIKHLSDMLSEKKISDDAPPSAEPERIFLSVLGLFVGLLFWFPAFIVAFPMCIISYAISVLSILITQFLWSAGIPELVIGFVLISIIFFILGSASATIAVFFPFVLMLAGLIA